MIIDKSKPVMLTGATGYVAGRIAEKLLKEGHTVHAPIRNPESKEKTKYLDEIAAKALGNIKYFKADLLDDGSYAEAMEGCELVIHTASPFTQKVKDAQKELVDPALKGTTNVLNSVKKINSVKRVVLTSSCVAIYGDAKDILEYPNQILTEEQWNTTSSVNKAPYSYSKVVAEKKAWEMNNGETRWDLVVVNPSFVIGPGINPFATSESFNIIKQMGNGDLKMGAADIQIGCVDVRDLAIAHYKAGYTAEAKGRHIANAENTNFLEMANMLRPKYGSKYPLPKRNLPKWLMWLVSPVVGIPRQFVKDNVGYPWKADNSKIIKELGMEFRPVKDSLNEFFQQMVDIKAFDKNK